MTLMRRFFSAPTLTQALLAAARHHQVTPEEIAYQTIDKRQGFIKTPRGVVIEVDPDAPTRAARPAAAESRPPAEPPSPPAPAEPEHPKLEPVVAAPPPAETEVPFQPVVDDAPREHPGLSPVAAEMSADEPAAPAAPASASPRQLEEDGAAADDDRDTKAAPAATPVVIDEALREAVAEAADELACLAALRVQASRVSGDDDHLTVELEGPDGARLVARGGRALLAMQHLLPRLLFGRLGRSLHCQLDCEGFHAARSERLEGLAQKAAERVRRGGRAWLLDPMPPDERRLVHLALTEEADIATESVGQGFLKRVRVAQVDSESE